VSYHGKCPKKSQIFSDDNINWIFGAGFPNLSPTRANPVMYYIFMVTVPPLLIYIPTNMFALRFIPILKQVLNNSRIRLNISCISIIFPLIIAILSIFIGTICNVNTNIPNSILSLSKTGETFLDRIGVNSKSPLITNLVYKKNVKKKRVLVTTFDSTLPIRRCENSYQIFMKEILKTIPLEKIPSVPQEIIVRGNRGMKGTIICAVVISDKFYLQHKRDLNIALDYFEVRCQIGLKDMREYINFESNKPNNTVGKISIGGNEFVEIYGVTILSIQNELPIARSPVYIFKRTLGYTTDKILSLNKSKH